MVKIITRAPYKSPILARYQALQIRRAEEMATQESYIRLRDQIRVVSPSLLVVDLI